MGSSPQQPSNVVCGPGCFRGALTTGHCTHVVFWSHFLEHLVRFRVRETEAIAAAVRAEVLGRAAARTRARSGGRMERWRSGESEPWSKIT